MSRTWIEFLNCFYGYAIKYDKIFKNTPYAIDKYREDAIKSYEYYKNNKKKFYEDYRHIKYDCDYLGILENEYDEYISQYHPELKGAQNLPAIFVTCDEFIGIDESYGHPNSIYIVLGHELDAKLFKSKKSDVNGMNLNELNLYFPDDVENIFIDFLARFYMKICLKTETIDEETVAKTKEDLKKGLKEGIFANCKQY